MHFEISIAVNYILSNLYTKLPRRRVDSFGEELQRSLCAKFQNHWFPNEPPRETAFRCLNATATHVDIILSEAAAISGLDWNEIHACLPDGLVISIDPGHVSYQYNQPGYMSHEVNKFSNSSFWPSASVSLSSSGCSSASSSASSTNMTNNSSTQVTHQVLYSAQDNLPVCNKHIWNDRMPHNQISRKLHSELEKGDTLATATALSVLVEPEDITDASRDFKRLAGQNQYLFSESLWNADSVVSGFDASYKLTANDAFQNDVVNGQFEPPQRLELINNGYESGLGPANLSWSSADFDTESTLVSMLSGHSNCVGIPGAVGDRNSGLCHVTNRSASNPAKSSGLGVIPPLGGLCEDNLRSTCHLNSMPNPGAPQGNALYPFLVSPMPTIANTHYPQKSISTPSFTAATFAQTKFGSTKLKSHTKRAPSRILPPTAPQSAFVPLNESGEPASRENGSGMTLRSIQSCFSAAIDNEPGSSSTRRFPRLQTTEIALNGSVRNLPLIGASLASKLTDPGTVEPGAPGESSALFAADHLATFQTPPPAPAPPPPVLENRGLLVPPPPLLSSASSHSLAMAEMKAGVGYSSASGHGSLFQAQTTNKSVTELANYFEVPAMKRMGIFEPVPGSSGLWPICPDLRQSQESVIKPPWLSCEQSLASLSFGVNTDRLCNDTGISSGQCAAKGLEENGKQASDTIDFSDNAILPTRMVNLLLEDDVASEPVSLIETPALNQLNMYTDQSTGGNRNGPSASKAVEDGLDLAGSLVHLGLSAIEGT